MAADNWMIDMHKKAYEKLNVSAQRLNDLPHCPFCKGHDLEIMDVWAEEFEEECACCTNCHAQVPVKVWNNAAR